MSIDVGVQLAPQATTTDELRRSWRDADAEGLDSIWVRDHFFPLYGDPHASHIIIMLGAPFDLGPALEAKARLST